MDTVDRLFPVHFRKDFFSNILGVGEKVAHLVAEAGYGVVVGPAVDRHVFRYTISVGSGCPLLVKNDIRYNECLKRCYPRDLWVPLNEVPATLGQLLAEADKMMRKRVIRGVMEVGYRTNYVEEMRGFLSHYVPLTDIPQRSMDQVVAAEIESNEPRVWMVGSR